MPLPEEEKKEEEPISVRDKLIDNPNPLSRIMERVQDIMQDSLYVKMKQE